MERGKKEGKNLSDGVGLLTSILEKVQEEGGKKNHFHDTSTKKRGSGEGGGPVWGLWALPPKLVFHSDLRKKKEKRKEG